MNVAAPLSPTPACCRCINKRGYEPVNVRHSMWSAWRHQTHLRLGAREGAVIRDGSENAQDMDVTQTCARAAPSPRPGWPTWLGRCAATCAQASGRSSVRSQASAMLLAGNRGCLAVQVMSATQICARVAPSPCSGWQEWSARSAATCACAFGSTSASPWASLMSLAGAPSSWYVSGGVTRDPSSTASVSGQHAAPSI